MAERKRLILPGFLSHDTCKELEFIHKSCSTVGYRPHVFSTTLAHLIATNCACLIMPFIPIREKLKETVEDFFDCHFDVSIEFTGLISWTKGASIGWHSDDNRPYLKQRHYAAVCYLNNYNEDFKGGLFHFQEGEPTTVVPKIGDAIFYTADELSVHCVDEIIEGERCTLTLWFTRDSSHDEDVKLINQLSNRLYPFLNPTGAQDFNSVLHTSQTGKEVIKPDSCPRRIELTDSESVTDRDVTRHVHLSPDFISEEWLPLPASSYMYWVNEDHLKRGDAHECLIDPAEKQFSFDIRWARISLMGFEFSFDISQGSSKGHETDMQETNRVCTSHSSDALEQPLRLKWKGIRIPELFSNSLHAVQVVQFYCWKIQKQFRNCLYEDYRYGSGALTPGEASTGHIQSQIHVLNSFRKLLFEKFKIQDSVLLLEHNVKNSSSHDEQHEFNFEEFSRATDDWKHYLCSLWRALLISLPQWEAHNMIFPI